MEFKIAYLQAMREQAPRMFNELRRSGAMDAYLKAKTKEAYRMRDELLEGVPKLPNGVPSNPQDSHRAEEQVFAALIEFPPADRD